MKQTSYGLLGFVCSVVFSLVASLPSVLTSKGLSKLGIDAKPASIFSSSSFFLWVIAISMTFFHSR
ncbi:hypothetical protein SPYJRS4_0480 [Streptococcus pyogenes JRS4]|nr:hypothetical protein spyM18_0646 [Streptococcus pyogenes MGAS8232]AAT86638.1 Hypothetical membrane spanning protein [Streptococcus pyogenes MGAS10394]BAR43980.1 hypothetical protein SPYJRS4_0480 [Streptococcus pyogenes JRS4]